MADCLTKQNITTDEILSNLSDNNDTLSSNTNNQSTQNNSNKLKFMNYGLNQFRYVYQRIQSKVLYLKDEKIMNYRNILFFIFFLILLLYIFIDKIKSDKRKIMVYYDNKYQIEITKYNILYNINNDSSMNVTENITISYQGVQNTGFLRFIPIDNGVQIRKVQVLQITEKGIQKVHHDIYINGDNLVFDIGDYQIKYGKNESYFISYELFILNKTFLKENMMPLNVIGHDWDCKINNAFVQLIVPSSFTEAKCYIGSYRTTEECKNFMVQKAKNEKKNISMSIGLLKKYEGVTFNLYFTPKTLSGYADNSCNNYIMMTIVIFCIIIGLSFNAKNKNKITPVRYTSALNTLDPIIMSKVVNGSAKKSDVPSIIFYWASKGFLNINFDDVNDPVLTKNVDSLPDSYPSYQKYMFDKLFKNGNVVKTLELKYKFYKTINKVVNIVDMQTNQFTNCNTIILSFLFAVLGSISPIIAPMKLRKSISIYFKDENISVLFAILFVVIWFVRFLMTFKYIINFEYVFELIIVVVLCFFQLYYYLTEIPSVIISNRNKFILCITSEICVICSSFLITKTAYFKAKINEVFGFKEFIEHPVNEEFESFLKKDPELFYNFICYAQVLELSGRWENKFDSLTVSPPSWIVRSGFDNYYYNDYIWMHRRLHFINHSMVNNMVDSPPPENSHRSSSHSHGGGGGGFGGGGFGGGGGCGR